VKTIQAVKTIQIVLITALIAYLSGFGSGYFYRGLANAKGVIKQQDKDADAVLEHHDKEKGVIKYVTRYKTILKKIPDPSGCLDASSPDDYLKQLHDTDSKAKSGFN